LIEKIKTVTFFDDNGEIDKFGLKKIDDTHYVTAKIEIPEKLFKVKAEMTDVGGYTTTRVISKDIKSVDVLKRTGMLDTIAIIINQSKILQFFLSDELVEDEVNELTVFLKKHNLRSVAQKLKGSVYFYQPEKKFKS
jgi:hypothetical protein